MDLSKLIISLQKDPKSHEQDYHTLLDHYSKLIDLPSVDPDYLCAVIDTLCSTKQYFNSNLLLYIALHLRNVTDRKIKKALLNHLNSFPKSTNELILLQCNLHYKKVSLSDIKYLINYETVAYILENDEVCNKEVGFMCIVYFFYECQNQRKVRNVDILQLSTEKVNNSLIDQFIFKNEIKCINYELIEKNIYEESKLKINENIKSINENIKSINENINFNELTDNNIEPMNEEKINDELINEYKNNNELLNNKENIKFERKNKKDKIIDNSLVNVTQYIVKKNALNLIINNLFNKNKKLVFIALEYTLNNINTFLESITYNDGTKILKLLIRTIQKELEEKEIRFMKAELVLKLKNHFGITCSFITHYLIKNIKESKAMHLLIESVDDSNLYEVIDLLFEKVIFHYQDIKHKEGNKLVIYGLNVIREINEEYNILDLVKDRLETIDQKDLSIRYAVKSIYNYKNRDVTFIKKRMNKEERKKHRKE